MWTKFEDGIHHHSVQLNIYIIHIYRYVFSVQRKQLWFLFHHIGQLNILSTSSSSFTVSCSEPSTLLVIRATVLLILCTRYKLQCVSTDIVLLNHVVVQYCVEFRCPFYNCSKMYDPSRKETSHSGQLDMCWRSCYISQHQVYKNHE